MTEPYRDVDAHAREALEALTRERAALTKRLDEVEAKIASIDSFFDEIARPKIVPRLAPAAFIMTTTALWALCMWAFDWGSRLGNWK